MKSELDRAVSKVADGDEVFFGGFGYNQPFAAAHELVRHGAEDLWIVRASGDILLDQLIGAGCVRGATISHCWNAIGPTPTFAFRRAVEESVPTDVTIEEHGLGNLVLRLFAGARHLPFVPAGPVEGTGQFEFAALEDTFTAVTVDGETHHVLRPINPDIGFVHAHRADERGAAQVRGPTAEVKHGAMACDHLVVQAEEIVDSAEIRETPKDTVVPSFMVDEVVEVPGGSHPSGVLGVHDRDVDFLNYYGDQTETLEGFESFVDKWIHGVATRGEYMELVAAEGFGEAGR